MKSALSKTILFAGILLLGANALAADDSTATGWKKSLIWDITVTQTAYSDSWVGGEAGSVNWVSNLNGAASKQLKSWFNYRTNLRISFGQTKTQDTAKVWSDWRKSTDLIDFENVGLFTLDKYIDPYVAFRLETQFYDGSGAKKLYFSPARFTESAGAARKFYEKDNQVVLSRLGLAIRETRKTVIIDPVTLATDDSMFTDGGFESVTDATLKFHKNISYTGKLTLYKALFFSKSDEVKGTAYEDDWKAIDVNWENIISASVSKIVTVNLYTQFLYDKQVSYRGRLKETVAIGFVFKMI